MDGASIKALDSLSSLYATSDDGYIRTRVLYFILHASRCAVLLSIREEKTN
jgi:hypothetical protein